MDEEVAAMVRAAQGNRPDVGELMTLPELHRQLMERAPLPRADASRVLFRALRSRPESLPLLEWVHGEYPRMLSADPYVFEEAGEVCRFPSPRDRALNEIDTLAVARGVGLPAHLAVPKRAACLVFGFPLPAPAADELAPNLVQPEGGKWPHVKGQPWTDAERDALFRMRHKRRGMTGAALAAAAGTSRQQIDSLIGPARLVGLPRFDWPISGDWKPTEALMRECGLIP